MRRFRPWRQSISGGICKPGNDARSSANAQSRTITHMPNALVITAAGINSDVELARAFRQAGADVESLHLNQLVAQPGLIDRFDLIGLPGGFSFGDAVAAGRIMAAMIRQSLYQPLVRAVERGVPIIAPCNGFQIAVQAGLLPGPIGPTTAWPSKPARPTIALAQNTSARFIDRWVRIDITADTRCIWTRDLDLTPATAMLPIAHGEGRFIAESDQLLDQLEAAGQVAVCYAADDNPNGSIRHVAGICDPSGLIFGLMPHPERYTEWTQHPLWTRMRESLPDADPPGLQMFRNAVEHVRSRATATRAASVG
jgi:phosphoribosylformylglycinamidine synthase subunit PurQ / glutaminase